MHQEFFTVKEHSNNVVNLDDRRSRDTEREGTEFGLYDGDEQLDLHRYNSVPNYDAVAVAEGRKAFNRVKPELNNETQSPVAEIEGKISRLCAVRLKAVGMSEDDLRNPHKELETAA